MQLITGYEFINITVISNDLPTVSVHAVHAVNLLRGTVWLVTWTCGLGDWVPVCNFIPHDTML